MTVQTMSEMSHLHFATVGNIFEALNRVQIMHTISLFKACEVRSLALQTVHNLGVKWRSYGRLKTSAQSWARISQPRRHLEGCFVAVKPLFGTRVPFAAQFPSFRSYDTAVKSPLSCETNFWHMRAISKPRTLILQLQNELRNQFWAGKSLLSCKMAMKWSPSFEWAVKSPPSIEMAFKLQNWLAKWRKVCKNTLQSQEKLKKCQQSPATMHLKRSAPHTLGSHTPSLSLHF